VTEAKELNASIVVAHDLGDAGYEIHQGPDAAPTEDQKTKAIVAAISFLLAEPANTKRQRPQSVLRENFWPKQENDEHAQRSQPSEERCTYRSDSMAAME